jgi:lipopolysaccharide transport system permease protein
VEGFRSVLLGTVPTPWTAITMSLAIGLLLFLSGVFYFRGVERVFADVV